MSTKKDLSANSRSASPSGVKRVRSSPGQSSKEKRRTSSEDSMSKMGEPAGDVGSMSQSQLVDLMKVVMTQLFSEQLANVSTKEDIKSLREDNAKLQEENRKLCEEIEGLKDKVVAQEKGLDDLDTMSRRSNCIFRGLNYSAQDNLSEVIAKFCLEVLSVNVNPEFIYALPLGPIYKQRRPLKVSFMRIQDKLSIMNNVKRLKNTGITVLQDLPYNVRRRRSKLLLLRKEITRRNASLKVALSADRLFVNNNMFEWNILSGLRCGQEDGSVKIREVVGSDFSEFLSLLSSESLPQDYFTKISAACKTQGAAALPQGPSSSS